MFLLAFTNSITMSRYRIIAYISRYPFLNSLHAVYITKIIVTPAVWSNTGCKPSLVLRGICVDLHLCGIWSATMFYDVFHYLPCACTCFRARVYVFTSYVPVTLHVLLPSSLWLTSSTSSFHVGIHKTVTYGYILLSSILHILFVQFSDFLLAWLFFLAIHVYCLFILFVFFTSNNQYITCSSFKKC